ncbi:hypothetical protein JG688_00004103 [Phytophthora aleatoria]|uniref:Uncharacterized protein n=1 Tax=Phytophthora aleatoria TaxID=2496075 RepID=A0A8J5J176_9STRA|nr:hypothetical protein JG688_00004103 [Phytophthora aleatoria]
MRSYTAEKRDGSKKSVHARKIVESQDPMCEHLCVKGSTILEEQAVQTGIPTCESMASSTMKSIEDAGLLQHSYS